MMTYIRIILLCTVAGFLVATLFMIPGGGGAGAAKGALIGALIAWGEWRSKRKPAVVNLARR